MAVNQTKSVSVSSSGMTSAEFAIKTLGEPKYDTTLDSVTFVDNQQVIFDVHAATASQINHCLLERAGPRSKMYFEPANSKAAIVTCGGLCPGINSVVRAIVMSLWHRYGVKKIFGLKYGFEGLNPELSNMIELDPKSVREIHLAGGSILGTSRGPQDVKVMAKFLADNGFNMLFTIGGDGTLKGAREVSKVIEQMGLKISVIGVPKTVDNDLMFTQKTFGFDTAVDQSQIAIKSAHIEAQSQKNCIGLVKLMGRDSGFIALHASLASSDVNLVLLPEVAFDVEKVCEIVEWRLRNRGHCLIVVAEGAGQDIINPKPHKYDASGNIILGDVGVWLKQKLGEHCKKVNLDYQIKYIDPSYIIRAAPANASDSIYCLQLAHMAVHAAMSGRTDMTIGLVNGQFVHLPISKVVQSRKKVDPNDLLYQSLLDNTGMPRKLTNN